ncbi:unnamed protein product, partial [Heterotrigona itama]
CLLVHVPRHGARQFASPENYRKRHSKAGNVVSLFYVLLNTRLGVLVVSKRRITKKCRSTSGAVLADDLLYFFSPYLSVACNSTFTSSLAREHSLQNLKQVRDSGHNHSGRVDRTLYAFISTTPTLGSSGICMRGNLTLATVYSRFPLSSYCTSFQSIFVEACSRFEGRSNWVPLLLHAHSIAKSENRSDGHYSYTVPRAILSSRTTKSSNLKKHSIICIFRKRNGLADLQRFTVDRMKWGKLPDVHVVETSFQIADFLRRFITKYRETEVAKNLHNAITIDEDKIDRHSDEILILKQSSSCLRNIFHVFSCWLYDGLRRIAGVSYFEKFVI